MRLRALLLALAVTGGAVSVGVASGAHGKPPATTTSAPCTRFNLKGRLTVVGRSSFTMNVTTGGRRGPLTVGLSRDTDVFWTGAGSLAGPAVGEHVWAKGKVCGPTYTASWVLVSPRTAH